MEHPMDQSFQEGHGRKVIRIVTDKRVANGSGPVGQKIRPVRVGITEGLAEKPGKGTQEGGEDVG
jgi:hypothetical protein